MWCFLLLFLFQSRVRGISCVKREHQRMDAAVPRVGYKLKYKILKRFTKDLILVTTPTETFGSFVRVKFFYFSQENAALCDKAEEMQHRILVAQEERKFLWKKLMTFRGGGNLGAGNQTQTVFQTPFKNHVMQTKQGQSKASTHTH